MYIFLQNLCDTPTMLQIDFTVIPICNIVEE